MGFSDYLTGAFPGVRITSGKRDPNSALGRANPRSYHNIGQAWDVAPIPGMTFDQYRDRVKGDGWNVVEAIDEVSNPSKHATGPHWHMAVDGRKEQQPMASPLMSMLQSAPIYAQQPQPAQTSSLASYLQAPLTNEALQKPQMPDPSAGFVEMAPLPGVKPSTWGQGGKGWQIIGAIGDALQTMGGGQPTYMQGVREQQQQEADGRKWLQQLMAQREQKAADRVAEQAQWVQRQEYERANPGPSSMETDLAAWNRMSPEQKAQYAAMQDVKNPIAVSGPQGTYRVPRGFGQPSNGPTTQVIDGKTYYNINGKWYDNPEGR